MDAAGSLQTHLLYFSPLEAYPPHPPLTALRQPSSLLRAGPSQADPSRTVRS